MARLHAANRYDRLTHDVESITGRPATSVRDFVRIMPSYSGGLKMTVKQVSVQRFSLISSKSFAKVVAGIEGVVGRPHMDEFLKDVISAKTFAELEQVVHKVIGASGFMEFIRFDLGEIVRKARGKEAPQSLRLLIGNPLIMKQMLEPVPDAGSYAPVTVLIDERPDEVHLSYDRMASFLAPYGSAAALQVAQDLDSKVEALLTAAAG